MTAHRIAIVFPGQGSQSVGMFAGFDGDAVVAAALDEASSAVGIDLARLAAEGPAEMLGLTVNTQPVMLAAGAAFHRAWTAAGGPAPVVSAGHSLGEYTALVAAEALGLAQGARLVRFRAEAMQSAVPVGVGAMAAILGLDGARVAELCAEVAHGDVVEAVNFNDPQQTVIAGHAAAVARASDAAKAAGAKRALPLPVSAPFHSSLMKPAADALAQRLAGEPIAPTRWPVLHNIDVTEAGDADAIRTRLVRQAAGPVRWVDTVRAMHARGVTHVVECGPGKVLGGLVKRIEPAFAVLHVHDRASLDAALAALA